MFCTKCGAQLEDGAKFCTSCGAPVRGAGQPMGGSVPESAPVPQPGPQPVHEPQSEPVPQPEPAPVPASQPTPQPVPEPAPAPAPQPESAPQPAPQPELQPKKPKHRLGKKGKIAIAAGAACVVVVIIVAVVLLMPHDSKVEATYGQDGGLTCSVSTTIVPKDSKGDMLDKYTVTMTPRGKNSRGGKSYKIKVDGAGGFTPADFLNLPNGRYTMKIEATGGAGVKDGAQTVEVDYAENDDDAPRAIDLTPSEDTGKGTKGSAASSSSKKAGKSKSSDDSSKKVEANYSVEGKSIDASFPAAGEEDYTIQTTFDYPQFSAGKNTPTAGVEKLNAMFEQNAQGALSNAKSWTMGGSQQDQRYRDTCTNIDGNIACVRSYRYTSAGGVHGTDEFSATFYNLDTGEEVSLEDATGMSLDDLESAAKDAVDTYLASNPSDIYKDDDIDEHVEDIVSQENRYYVCKDGIVVMAGDYELGSFAFGTHEIMVKSDNGSLVGTDVSGVYATGYGN